MKYYVLSYIAVTGLLVSECVSEEDYFYVLGINTRANKNDIKWAYRQLLKEIHPDRNWCDPKAVEKFMLLTKAYDVLRDRKHLLYRRQNPGHGDYILKFDWDLPVCSDQVYESTATYVYKLYRRINWSYFVYLTNQTKKRLYKAFCFETLTRSPFCHILYGILLYFTADCLSKCSVFHFISAFILLFGTSHLLLTIWLTKYLLTTVESWIGSGVTLLSMWTLYLAEMCNLVGILLHGTSLIHPDLLHYMWSVIAYYSIVVLLITVYFVTQHPLHQYPKCVTVCSTLLKVCSIYIIYISLSHTNASWLLCASVILGILPKVASDFVKILRLLKCLCQDLTCAAVKTELSAYNWTRFILSMPSADNVQENERVERPCHPNQYPERGDTNDYDGRMDELEDLPVS